MQYALIESGLVANIIVADAEFIATLPGTWVPADGAGIGWAYADGVFTPPTPAEQPAQQARVSRLAFRKRFTQAEQVAIELASIDNPAGTAEQRQQQAALRVYLKNVDAAQYIDLADPATVAGVRALEAAQLLTTSRADAILTAPVQPEERP